jgi:hypothetical protein
MPGWRAVASRFNHPYAGPICTFAGVITMTGFPGRYSPCVNYFIFRGGRALHLLTASSVRRLQPNRRCQENRQWNARRSIPGSNPCSARNAAAKFRPLEKTHDVTILVTWVCVSIGAIIAIYAVTVSGPVDPEAFATMVAFP